MCVCLHGQGGGHRLGSDSFTKLSIAARGLRGCGVERVPPLIMACVITCVCACVCERAFVYVCVSLCVIMARSDACLACPSLSV